MIGVIDVGYGNTGSVLRALERIDAPVKAVSMPEDAAGVDRWILPGVGAFGPGLRALQQSGLLPILHACVLEQDMPLLGICLGMHLLARGSEEGGGDGLGWLPADIRRLTPLAPLRCPHMGWNTILSDRADPLLAGLEANASFYFAHSYRAVCEADVVAATTDYGERFPAVVRCGSVVGVQFHPEKSHAAGLRFLANFAQG